MIRTDSGWQEVKEVVDTGRYEAVYNLRVADFHTYFVGEASWGYAAWAHNTYAPVKTYSTGIMFSFTGTNYSSLWFVPNAFLVTQPGSSTKVPNALAKAEVNRDQSYTFGMALQNEVTSLRTGWNSLNLTQPQRYGNSLTNVVDLLGVVNTLRIASGGSAISLDDYDNPTLPAPPPTPNPQPALGPAWQAFNAARALARGNYIHDGIKTWVATQPSASYHFTGPDVDQHGAAPMVYYEVYPAGGDNQATHATRPGMDVAPWKEVTYVGGR